MRSKQSWPRSISARERPHLPPQLMGSPDDRMEDQMVRTLSLICALAGALYFPSRRPLPRITTTIMTTATIMETSRSWAPQALVSRPLLGLWRRPLLAMDACRLYLDLRGLRVLGPKKGAGIAGPLFRFSVPSCGLSAEAQKARTASARSRASKCWAEPPFPSREGWGVCGGGGYLPPCHCRARPAIHSTDAATWRSYFIRHGCPGQARA